MPPAARGASWLLISCRLWKVEASVRYSLPVSLGTGDRSCNGEGEGGERCGGRRSTGAGGRGGGASRNIARVRGGAQPQPQQRRHSEQAAAERWGGVASAPRHAGVTLRASHAVRRVSTWPATRHSTPWHGPSPPRAPTHLVEDQAPGLVHDVHRIERHGDLAAPAAAVQRVPRACDLARRSRGARGQRPSRGEGKAGPNGGAPSHARSGTVGRPTVAIGR